MTRGAGSRGSARRHRVVRWLNVAPAERGKKRMGKKLCEGGAYVYVFFAVSGSADTKRKGVCSRARKRTTARHAPLMSSIESTTPSPLLSPSRKPRVPSELVGAPVGAPVPVPPTPPPPPMPPAAGEGVTSCRSMWQQKREGGGMLGFRLDAGTRRCYSRVIIRATRNVDRVPQFFTRYYCCRANVEGKYTQPEILLCGI